VRLQEVDAQDLCEAGGRAQDQRQRRQSLDELPPARRPPPAEILNPCPPSISFVGIDSPRMCLRVSARPDTLEISGTRSRTARTAAVSMENGPLGPLSCIKNLSGGDSDRFHISEVALFACCSASERRDRRSEKRVKSLRAKEKWGASGSSDPKAYRSACTRIARGCGICDARCQATSRW